jgi:hypothetical protein
VNKDIYATNQKAVLYWIDKYIEELKLYRQLVSGNDLKLEELLRDVRGIRQSWLETEGKHLKGRGAK